jgi:hypothetical protein
MMHRVADTAEDVLAESPSRETDAEAPASETGLCDSSSAGVVSNERVREDSENLGRDDLDDLLGIPRCRGQRG